MLTAAAPLLTPADPNYPIILAFYVGQATLLLAAVASAGVLPGSFANPGGPVVGLGGGLV